MTLVGTLYAYTGMTLLCLAMPRHFRYVWRRELSARGAVWLRLSGWVLVGVSLFACAADTGWWLGIVEWAGATTAATVALIFLLSYRPKAAVSLAAITPLVATMLAGFA